MTRRTYPLKIEVWGEDGEELLSRGHHDPTAFLAACVRHLREQGSFYADAGSSRAERRELLTCGRWDCGNVPPDPLGLDSHCTRLREVQYQWRRWLPPHKPCGCEWDDLRYTEIVAGPGRGVFPVTLVDLG